MGATGTVTGSCYLLDTPNTRIMIDCGMFQGPKEIRERNYSKFPVSPSTVDYIVLTHAHIDHSGLIPKIVKHGFRGKVIATAPTVELCEVLLPDSGYIQEMEVERKNRRNRRANKTLIEPIYNVQDAYNSLAFFEPQHYDEIIPLTAEIRVRFVDAGHILGSAMVEIWVKEGINEVKLVFSGDIGRKEQPLIKDPSMIEEADYVIMESTYGNRLHKQSKDEKELLLNVIWETYQKGGNLIIPAFAVERTQDLLYHLGILKEARKLPPMEIYIDSPLSTAATTIFQRNHAHFDEETLELMAKAGDPISLSGAKFTKTVEDSKSLNIVSGAIIISASGMCEAGRIRHHLKYNLWRPESTVLFVGYQPIGTLGRRIVDNEKTVRIFGEEIAVRADIRSIEGYSAHADQEGLLEWVGHFQTPPQDIFVVHGEPNSSNALAEAIRDQFAYHATVPVWHQVVELSVPGAVDPSLRATCQSLSSKLRALLDRDLMWIQREELSRRLADLEAYLDQELKK